MPSREARVITRRPPGARTPELTQRRIAVGGAAESVHAHDAIGAAVGQAGVLQAGDVEGGAFGGQAEEGAAVGGPGNGDWGKVETLGRPSSARDSHSSSATSATAPWWTPLWPATTP
ncbi:hypothetical protein JCM4814A_78850 [Streptomyces phaeofaciens JCM 4814]|uniref:Uncharacterized protein n=1 Tax=Streptomyces phaeofaciens TaxID=68254 RepID=A0A918M0X9_9ACTN|nr:hypothetical protein GCM10010226_87220 [Streptomyces phaeofaciens]